MTGPTTWSVNREQLVRDLAAARAENELLRRQNANRILRNRRTKAESTARMKQREDRQFKEQLREAVDSTPPDPRASQHRAALIAALKENA